MSPLLNPIDDFFVVPDNLKINNLLMLGLLLRKFILDIVWFDFPNPQETL